ncbi:hypothetical protein TIFTF001_055937, partial [Ficus carica]
DTTQGLKRVWCPNLAKGLVIGRKEKGGIQAKGRPDFLKLLAGSWSSWCPDFKAKGELRILELKPPRRPVVGEEKKEEAKANPKSWISEAPDAIG